MALDSNHPLVRIVDHFGSAAIRSPSAEMVAVMRAAHQSLDEPVIHVDPLATRIIGAEARRWMKENDSLLRIEYICGIRTMVAIRSRLCEDELRLAVENGTTQYVVLGAGLDTFAYRQPGFAQPLTIFEVDQPSTQAWKIERLREAGIEPPANLRFVPVDFNAGTLAESLAAAGFKRDAPAFFAWLGVSYYLPLTSIIETLRFIAGQQAACSVILDIALDEGAVPPAILYKHRRLRDGMSLAAEPWLTWLDPEEFRGTLREIGFTQIEISDENPRIKRFIAGRDDLALVAVIVAKKG